MVVWDGRDGRDSNGRNAIGGMGEEGGGGGRVIRSRRVMEREAREAEEGKKKAPKKKLRLEITLSKNEIADDFQRIMGGRAPPLKPRRQLLPSQVSATEIVFLIVNRSLGGGSYARVVYTILTLINYDVSNHKHVDFEHIFCTF